MVSGGAVVDDGLAFAFSEEQAVSVGEATDESSTARSIWLGPVRRVRTFGICVAAMSLWAACAGGVLIEALSSGSDRLGEVDPDLEI